MIFSSFQFFVFFPVVLLLYYGYRGKGQLRYRQCLLLLASYVFYASWDARFLSLILTSTVVDYIAGYRIPRASSQGRRRAWLLFSMGVNLGLLCFFKYANFFIASFQDLLGLAGLHTDPILLNIILPVGISFYTFQTMSYSLDIYRGKLEPTRDFIEFALFVAFFPQLVAGPIVRAVEFLPQVRRKIMNRWVDMVEGINRFAIGFAKKIFIADNISPFVDQVYGNLGAYDACTLWLAAMGFAVQVYCDFSGYSDMAIGAARLLGFRLPENFRFPFTATNVADFWRRWHITLYSFMRDYLYIGMGGSRVGPIRLVFNLLATMTIVGLWHGANWQFMVWGFYNGMLILGQRMFMIPISKSKRLLGFMKSLPGKILSVALVNLLFFLGLLWFRGRNFLEATESIRRMLCFDMEGERLIDPIVFWLYGLVMMGCLAAELNLPGRIGARTPLPLKLVGYFVLIVILVLFGAHDTQAFLYFQF